MKTTYLALVALTLLLLVGPPAFLNQKFTSGGPLASQSSETLLSPQVVASACPNLPTANGLLNNGSLSLQIFNRNDNSAVVANYSSTVLGYMTGQIYPNFVAIFVTNGKVWVEIPENILQETGCLSAIANYQTPQIPENAIFDGLTSTASASTWGVGGYSNPGTISGNYHVTGVQSTIRNSGTWSPNTSNCPNSVCYLGYDVVTLWDNMRGYQLVLQNILPHNSYTNAQGYDAVVEVWSTAGLISSADISISYSSTQYYPLQISYSSSASKWQFFYNNNLIDSISLVTGENPYMLIGNQPSSVVESDDNTQGDFAGFSSGVGFMVPPGNGGYCPCLSSPAISYFFNGEWNPAPGGVWPPTGKTDAAYVYDGGSTSGFAFSVAQTGPPTWIGLSSPSSEEMSFCVSGSGCSTPSPSQGTLLWKAAPDPLIQTSAWHSSPPSTTFTLGLSSSVNQGDLLVAMAGTYASASFGVSDSQGNTWNKAINFYGTDSVIMWYTVAKSTGSDSVTFTTTSTSTYTYGFVTEFSGPSGTLDKTAFGYGSGNPQVTSFTPSSGTVVIDIAAGPSGWSPAGYFTMVGASTGWSAASEYAVNWNGGSTTASWGNTGGYSEVAASFK